MKHTELQQQQQQDTNDSNPPTTRREEDKMNSSSRSFDFDTDVEMPEQDNIAIDNNNNCSPKKSYAEAAKMMVDPHPQNDDDDCQKSYSTQQWRDSPTACCRSLNEDCNVASLPDRHTVTTLGGNDQSQSQQQQQQQLPPQSQHSSPVKTGIFVDIVYFIINLLQSIINNLTSRIKEDEKIEQPPTQPQEEQQQQKQKPQQEYDYDRMVVLHSAPLAFRDKNRTIRSFDYHDFTGEKQKIRDAFNSAYDICMKRVDVTFYVATLDQFEKALTSNTYPILHFSCHGHPDHLYLESEIDWGLMNCIRKESLKNMVFAAKSSSGGQQRHENLQVVFVAACHSEEIGNAFLEAGVRHVVCCPTDTKIRDIGAMIFARSFYQALGCGRTLKEAVQMARAKVSESTDQVRDAKEEAKKYLLLPREKSLNDPDYHNVRVFYQKQKKRPLPERHHSYAIQRYLPPQPQAFRGGAIEKDKYRILTNIRTKRITQIIVGAYQADPTLLAKAVCHYLKERSQIFALEDILWIDPKSSSIPLNDSVARSFKRALDILINNLHGFNANIGDHPSASLNYEECCSQIVGGIGTKSVVIFLQVRHITSDGSAAMQKLQLFVDHIVEETHQTVKFVIIGPSGFDIIRQQPVLPTSPDNSITVFADMNNKKKNQKKIVDAYFAFQCPSTKLDHLDVIPRLCFSLKQLSDHISEDTTMECASVFITDGRLEDLKKELRTSTTRVRLLVWCSEGIEKLETSNNRDKTSMDSPILSAIAKRKPKLVLICLKYGAQSTAKKLVRQLDIDAVVIWISMDPFQKDAKWMYTELFHPFCKASLTGKINLKESLAVLKEKSFKAGCKGCDMESQAVILPGLHKALPKSEDQVTQGVKLLTHSCSTTPWFLSREVRNLKMNVGDYSLLDEAKDYVSRQSEEEEPCYLFLTPEWEATNHEKKTRRKLSERARAVALYVCNEVGCNSSRTFGGGIYLVSSEDEKTKAKVALAETVERALVWVDFQRTAEAPIFESAKTLHDWVERIGKKTTVVVILTGDEKYLQHIFHLEEQLYSFSTKYEHIEIKRSTAGEDFPIRNLIGFVRILPLKKNKDGSEDCVLDWVPLIIFRRALEKVLLPEEENDLRDEIRFYRDDDGSVQVRLSVSDFRHLTRLRDLILMGDAAEQISEEVGHSIHFDRSAMAEIYESLILQLESPTKHQQEKLEEIETKRRVRIEAPAGTGKTFVALNSTIDFLERTKPDEKILYICRNSCLAIHFVKWLCYRMQKESGLQKTLKRLYTLSDDGTYGICSYTYNRKKGILDVFAYKNPSALLFGKIIVDDAHDIFGNHRDSIIRVLREKARRVVDKHDGCELMVLSDESQASVNIGGEITYPKDLSLVQMTEVCRNSKRIVAGALAYQLPGANHLSCAHDSVGVPLSPILFDCDSSKEIQTYAEQIIEAIGDVLQEFPGLNLHDRLAIVVPDERFREELCCGALLGDMLERNIDRFDQHLVPKTALEASRALNLNNPKPKESWVVVDCVDKLEGLERLIVFGVGLDESLADVSTPNAIVRARIYRAITRAHLSYFLINKRIEKGWFEFIEALDFEKDGFSLDEEMKMTKSGSAITLIRENSAELLAEESFVGAGPRSTQGGRGLGDSSAHKIEQGGSNGRENAISSTQYLKQGTWNVRKRRLQKEHRRHPFFMPFKSIHSQGDNVTEQDPTSMEFDRTPTKSNVKSSSYEIEKEPDDAARSSAVAAEKSPSNEQKNVSDDKSAASLKLLPPSDDSQKPLSREEKIILTTPPPKPDQKPVGRVPSFRDMVMLGNSESLNDLSSSTPTSTGGSHHDKVSPIIIVEPIRRQTISMMDFDSQETIKEEEEVHPEFLDSTEDYYHQKIKGAQARQHRTLLRPDEAKRKEHSIMKKEVQKKIQRRQEAKLADAKSPKNSRPSA